MYLTISLILPKGAAAAKPNLITICLDLVFHVSNPSSICRDSFQASFLLAGVEILNHV